MKTLDYLHLDASAVSNVVASLKQLLADYQVFYTNLRGFHWNIKGHGFFVLHGKFEDMYNNAAEKVDELAERILMLGGEPENKFSEYLKVACVKEVSGVSCGDEALKNILDTYGHLIGEELTIAFHDLFGVGLQRGTGDGQALAADVAEVLGGEVETDFDALFPEGFGVLLHQVLAVGGVHDVEAGGFGVPEAEAVVVLAGENGVLEAG